MARSRVSPGEETKPEQYRLGQTDHADFTRHAKRLGISKAEISRKLAIKWIREQNRHVRKLKVTKRAKKGAQKSFPIRLAASKRKKKSAVRR